MTSCDVVEGIDLQLPIVDHVLIAICRVQVDGPEEYHGAEGEALAVRLDKGLALAVNSGPSRNGGPGNRESQYVLWVDA